MIQRGLKTGRTGSTGAIKKHIYSYTVSVECVFSLATYQK